MAPLPTDSTEPAHAEATTTAETPTGHGAGLAALVLGALGVVFGDIGTSPLYTLKGMPDLRAGRRAGGRPGQALSGGGDDG
jgi:hypothetical protein